MNSNIDNTQLKLTDGRVISFNDDQQESLAKINNWLKSKNNFFYGKIYNIQ